MLKYCAKLLIYLVKLAESLISIEFHYIKIFIYITYLKKFKKKFEKKFAEWKNVFIFV